MITPTSHRTARRDFWAITTYFNFLGYTTKKRNLRVFREHLRAQGIPLIAVEAALPGASFELESGDADILVQRRATAILRQKERLLNIALEFLPKECDKVVWVDGDTVFPDPRWIEYTAGLLKQHAVVQPFSEVWRLAQGADVDAQVPSATEIFPGTVHMHADPVYANRVTGAPGTAMAFRRDVLERCRFYDRMILGSGDTLMMGAYLGVPIPNLEYIACVSADMRRHTERWWRETNAIVGGNIACTPGVVYTLWHGERNERRYYERQWLLESFDPECDIRMDDNGCWEWCSEKPELHRNVRHYFLMRQEDGNAVSASHLNAFEKEIQYGATRARLSALRKTLTRFPVYKSTDPKKMVSHVWHSIVRRKTTHAPQERLSEPFRFSTDWFTAKSDAWHEHLSHLKGKEHLHYLEIGSWEGRSVCWMLEHVLTHATARATCIDLFPQKPAGRFLQLAMAGKFPVDLDIEAHFDHNIRVLGASGKVRKLKGDSRDILPGLPEHAFDCIYIDGDHHATNALKDAMLSWRLLKTGGILLFDDYKLKLYSEQGMNPGRGIDAFLDAFAPYLSLLHKGKQVFVRKERSQVPSDLVILSS